MFTKAVREPSPCLRHRQILDRRSIKHPKAILQEQRHSRKGRATRYAIKGNNVTSGRRENDLVRDKRTDWLPSRKPQF